MESRDGVADSNSVIAIRNNTCDYYQDNGITVHGVEDENDAGVVILLNNIVSESYIYGLNLVDGYMYATVTNTGYYDNPTNKNWDFNEFNPVEADDFPYLYGEMFYENSYLDQNCPFIDAGLEYIEQTELIGKTTDVNSFPDSNYTDIGFHYPNWDFSNAGSGDSLSADLDDNMTVNFTDFAVLAARWKTTYDINDLGILATQWLQLADPNIQIHTYGDSNDGYVDIGVSGYTQNTERVFLLAEGKYIGEIFGFVNDDTLTMDISESGGLHRQFKVISISTEGRITCSNISEVEVACYLNYCIFPRYYEPNEPLYFSAYNSTAENATVNVYADGLNLVWSQNYDGNNVLGLIPAGITGQHEIDYVSLDCAGQSVIKGSEPELDLWGTPSDLAALIILPEPIWGREDDMLRLSNIGLTEAVVDAFEQASVKYKKLGAWSATFENIKELVDRRPNIRYIYFDGHGSHRLENDPNLRTCVKLWDGWTVSVKQSDFPLGQAPPWCKKLGGNREKTINSFYKMGFRNLEFAYFNCCDGGKLKINDSEQLVIGQDGQYGIFDGLRSDMSFALGMHNSNPDKNRVYQSWYDKISSGDASKFNKWGKDQWGKLGEGENLGVAIPYAYGRSSQDGATGRYPSKDYRLKGRGDYTAIILY